LANVRNSNSQKPLTEEETKMANITKASKIRAALTKNFETNQVELAAEIGCTPGFVSQIKKTMTRAAPAARIAAPAVTEPVIAVDIFEANDLAMRLISMLGASKSIVLIEQLEKMRKNA